MSDKDNLSLSDKFFLAARDLPGVEKRYQDNIKLGTSGTAFDAEQRLVELAATIKQKLVDFIEDVENGRTRIASPGESHRHDEDPLKLQISLPAGLDHQEAFDLFNKLLQSKGAKDFTAIVESPAVGMRTRTSFQSDSLIGGGKPPTTVYSLMLEINPLPRKTATAKPMDNGRPEMKPHR